MTALSPSYVSSLVTLGAGVFLAGALAAAPAVANDAASGGKDNFRTAGKVTSHIYPGDSSLSLYAHVYDFRDYGFNGREQDQILGLGYRTTFANGLWFKPFIGAARVQSDGYTGMNGYMAGWVAGYGFTALDQNFVNGTPDAYQNAMIYSVKLNLL